MARTANSGVDAVVKDITYHPKTRLKELRALSLELQGAVFEKLSPHVQQDLIEGLRIDELIRLLDQFDLQRTENILARIKNIKKRHAVAHALQSELEEKAEYFLRFHPKAELSLLSFNYLILSEHTTLHETADRMEEHYREVGRLPEILVHRDGVCVGEVSPTVLVRESGRKKLAAFITTVPTVHYTDSVEDIIDTFERTRHSIIIVEDVDGSVVGIIYADDARKLLGRDPGASLYDFAGVSDNEHVDDSVRSKVRHRYKWLIINLSTCFIAASVVGLFEDTLSELVLLAMYMPVVAGMGGNAATQTLAVMVRGISVGEATLRESLRPILNETGAGVINGFINGTIVAIVATIFNQDPLLGLVVGGALVVNLGVAGFFGALVPLVMKSLGKDPATSATIFITTATDVIGFFVFLGLASVVLL